MTIPNVKSWFRHIFCTAKAELYWRVPHPHIDWYFVLFLTVQYFTIKACQRLFPVQQTSQTLALLRRLPLSQSCQWMLIAPGCLAPPKAFVQSAEIPLMFKEIMFFLQCHFNKIAFYSSPSAVGSPFRTPCHYYFAWQILTGKGLYFPFSSCCLSVRADVCWV